MKKLRGGFSIILNKDKSLAISFYRNTVYVNSIKEYTCITTIKSLSNISYIALSHDETKLAVKNTSGTIEILEIPEGKSMGICKMKSCEGYQMYFSEDDKYIYDFDWNGNFMLLDINIMQYRVIFCFKQEVKPYIFYNPYNKTINALFSGSQMVQEISIDNYEIKEKIMELDNNFNGLSWEVTFSKNLYLFYIDKKVIVLNSNFKHIFSKSVNMGILKGLWISESERMLFVINYDRAMLYEFPKMILKQEFTYPYMSGAAFVENEAKIAIATWSGTYVDDIQM